MDEIRCDEIRCLDASMDGGDATGAEAQITIVEGHITLEKNLDGLLLRVQMDIEGTRYVIVQHFSEAMLAAYTNRLEVPFSTLVRPG